MSSNAAFAADKAALTLYTGPSLGWAALRLSFTVRLRIINTPVSLTFKDVVLHLRSATPADLVLLRHWDEQPHVIASDPNDEWGLEVELDRILDWREQLIAEVDDRPIGFVQIIDPAREESHYWGDVPAGLRAIDIWIGEESDLGKGYGTQMMQLALARCFADPAVTAVLVDPLASNTRAHHFYERLGFQFVEQRGFGKDDCCVYRLKRADWHQESG